MDANSDQGTRGPLKQSPASSKWLVQATLGLAIAIVFLAAALLPPVAGAQADEEAGDAAAADTAPDAGKAALRDPVLDADAEFAARRATSWRDGEIRWLLLEDDFTFSVGAYGFRAKRALVRIERDPQPGKTVHHFSIYLDSAQSLRGGAMIEASAPRLLVTASTRGQVEMSADLLEQKVAAGAFVDDGKQRMARHRQAVAGGIVPADLPDDIVGPAADELRRQRRAEIEAARADRQPQPPRVVGPIDPGDDHPFRDLVERPAVSPTERPRQVGSVPQVDVAPRDFSGEGDPDDPTILPAAGIVTFSFKSVSIQPLNEEERAVTLTGDVRVMYQDRDSGRTMTLTAASGVIFLAADSDPTALASMQATDIKGIYLEDNVVVTDGRYTVRAPRIFIDPSINKAILLEAVVFAIDVNQQIPIYMRAAEIRQEARTSFSASDAVLTTSDFAEPHFSIAASRLELTELKTVGEGGAGPGPRFVAKGIKPKVGNLPIGYWPYASGRPGRSALKHIELGFSDERDGDTNVEVQTFWDVFALTNRDAPEGVDLTGRIDFRGDHGVALGADLEYEMPDMFGFFRGYMLPYDNGDDDIGNRRPVEFDNEFRGFALWRHRHYLENNIELSLQFAYVSDETFLEEFFREEAYDTPTYETSIYVKQQVGQRAFTLLANTNLNDFLAQTTVLQSPGFFVERVPELGYYRIGTNLWENRLTYYTENRVSRFRVDGGDDRPFDRGFRPLQSLRSFGIPNTAAFDSRLAGFPSDWRWRFDSRHEIQAPMRFGEISVVPYVAGRLTAYDEDFEDYTGEGDNVRYWGMVGTRFHTEFQRSYLSASSRIFDVNKLRHIIEPSVNVFYMDSNMNVGDLPAFDSDVEAIQNGFGTRFGLRNTLQTQRGGEGRWRTVDWLVINTDFIVREDEDAVAYELPRFFDYRPEYTVGGDHFYSDVRWMLSDTLALTGEVTYDFDESDVPVWRAGSTMRHSPRLSSYVNYTEIDIVPSRIITYGFDYDLTRKWRATFRHRISISESETRDISLILERRIPQASLFIFITHDDIDDEQTIGISFRPQRVDFGAFDPGIGSLP